MQDVLFVLCWNKGIGQQLVFIALFNYCRFSFILLELICDRIRKELCAAVLTSGRYIFG